MTLQIGLVGSDGIVLAGDRLQVNYDGGEPTRSLTSKFFYSDQVVCCWSGYAPAMYAAKFIQDFDWPKTSNRGRSLIECGDRGWRTVHGQVVTTPKTGSMVTKVLAVFTDDCTLWELDVYEHSIAHPIVDKVVTGQTQTTAKYFVNNHTSTSMPVEELITIAAHAIVMGNRDDSAYIDGLEVAVFRKAGPLVILTPEQEADLKLISGSIYETISREVRRPFDYRPAQDSTRC